jgi:hypothetical protein
MNTELQSWVKSVDKKLDNHIQHILPTIARIEADVKWLKGFFWKVATPILGVIGLGLVYIVTLLR